MHFLLASLLALGVPASARQIKFGSDSSTCLTVQARAVYDGARVIVNTCVNGTDNLWQYQNWASHRGSGTVRLEANDDFCLDADANPHNGNTMQMWTCQDNAGAQKWYYTDDDRIALQDQGFCLDLPGGNTAPFTRTQIWECSTGNTNQVWRS